MEEVTSLPSEVDHYILCCKCGTPIKSNPSNTCIDCLRMEVDITEGLPKQSPLSFCKGCERYLLPPNNWISCSLESKELLRLCLKRLKGLNKVHLIDAGFIWTEPHSKRIKVKLTIQKEALNSAKRTLYKASYHAAYNRFTCLRMNTAFEMARAFQEFMCKVLGSTIVEQVFIVDYIVHYQMCEECHRREAQDYWRAVVQVRQKATHKRTFMYLEQLILKHQVHTSALQIKECHDGLDFYYATKQAARKMVDFLGSSVACRLKTSEELVSHDIHNNKFQYKHSFSVEIIPISKNDLVCLPAKLAQSLGNINQIVICSRITSILQLLDPVTLKVAEVSNSMYWRFPFSSFCDHRQLIEFFVLHIETCTDQPLVSKNSGVKADVWVVPLNELGISGRQIHCRTHLGHILKDGDTAMGFNFSTANLNDANFESMKSSDIPHVILVKKSYGDKQKRHKLRNWTLQHLNKEVEGVQSQTSYNRDYTEFLENLEEDQNFRENVNIYYNPSVDGNDKDDLDVPQIALEEMIKELSLGEK